MIGSVAIALLLLQTPRDTPATRVPVGSAVLGGVVTTGDAPSKVPLRRAIVTISGTGIPGFRQTATDESGRFAFDGLQAGRFNLTVEKAAYLKIYVGSRRPGKPPSTPIALVDGQRILDLAIDVARGAAIEGTVHDELGGPVATAQVSVLQQQIVGGETRFVRPAGSMRAIADDRGHYRIYGLAPGDYVVEATSGGGLVGGADIVSDDGSATRSVTRSVVYAPGVADTRAAHVVSVAVGEERTSVDIVNALVPSARLTVFATGPAGQPLENINVGVANLSLQSVAFSPGIIRPGPDGRAAVPGLAPATYQIYGRASETTGTGPLPLWVNTEVVVNGTDVAVPLQFGRGQNVSGRFTAEKPLPKLMALANVTLDPVVSIAGTSLGIPEATVEADGTFTFHDVPPGKYRLKLIAGAWKILSAVYQERDTLDVPLEVNQGADVEGLNARITDQPTQISGLVSDALGRPSPEYSVVVFPKDATLRSASPRRSSGLVKIGTDGRFKVENLPPGDYLLAVIVDADSQQLSDPVFLEQAAAGAIAIRLSEGQKLVQDLKIGG